MGDDAWVRTLHADLDDLELVGALGDAPVLVSNNPFDVQPGDVAALVPEATIPDTLAPGQRGVTLGHVTNWILRLSAVAELRLHGWDALPDAKAQRVKTAARIAVADGVAGMLEAARAPERAGLADTSYAAVLWARWQAGIDTLARQVTGWLADTPATSHAQPAAAFPPPTVLDTPRW